MTDLCRLLLELPTLPQGEIVAFADLIIMSSDKEGDEEAVEWAALGLALRTSSWPSLRRELLTPVVRDAQRVLRPSHGAGGGHPIPLALPPGGRREFAPRPCGSSPRRATACPRRRSRGTWDCSRLCVKKHDLLHELLSTFARASSAQRRS